MSIVFEGFVVVGGDCNDNNLVINFGVEEIVCNGLDENCNGMGDDLLLLLFMVVYDMICLG